MDCADLTGSERTTGVKGNMENKCLEEVGKHTGENCTPEGYSTGAEEATVLCT